MLENTETTSTPSHRSSDGSLLRSSRKVAFARAVNVRYGSLADMPARSRHVRFTPDSGHSSVRVGCPIEAARELVRFVPISGRASPYARDKPVTYARGIFAVAGKASA
jgi:hypothetical protein